MSDLIAKVNEPQAEYVITSFGSYYGVYVVKGDLQILDLSNDGYLNKQNAIACHCSVACAIGLPEDAQFITVEECKEFVAKQYSEELQWFDKEDD